MSLALREPSEHLAFPDMACLTLELRDGYCEHCGDETQGPANPIFYDRNHEAAIVRDRPWAIWCSKPCGEDCMHTGQRDSIVKAGGKQDGAT